MPVRPDNVATPYVSLDDWHFERWRGNILAKLGDATALDSLMVALDGTPAPFVHATASLHCDIAHRPQRRPPDGPGQAGTPTGAETRCSTRRHRAPITRRSPSPWSSQHLRLTAQHRPAVT
jgi:hypothetical protein